MLMCAFLKYLKMIMYLKYIKVIMIFFIMHS